MQESYTRPLGAFESKADVTAFGDLRPGAVCQPNDKTEVTLPDVETDYRTRPGPNTTLTNYPDL